MATTYKLISSSTLSGTQSSVTFSSIPSTYTDLKLVMSARSDASGNNYGTGIKIYFNGSNSSLTYRRLYNSNGNPGSDNGANGLAGIIAAAGQTANTFSNGELYIPNYASSNYKSISSDAVPENNGTTYQSQIIATLWSSTAAITSLTLVTESGTDNFVSGSTFYLYGIKNS
jgi:hypothetical protein